jgi:hypothetical protein
MLMMADCRCRHFAGFASFRFQLFSAFAFHFGFRYAITPPFSIIFTLFDFADIDYFDAPLADSLATYFY